MGRSTAFEYRTREQAGVRAVALRTSSPFSTGCNPSPTRSTRRPISTRSSSISAGTSAACSAPTALRSTSHATAASRSSPRSRPGSTRTRTSSCRSPTRASRATWRCTSGSSASGTCTTPRSSRSYSPHLNFLRVVDTKTGYRTRADARRAGRRGADEGADRRRPAHQHASPASRSRRRWKRASGCFARRSRSRCASAAAADDADQGEYDGSSPTP